MNAIEFCQKMDKEAMELDAEERTRVWHLLTALRGPDSGDEELKMITTAKIRNAIFPRLSDGCMALVEPGRIYMTDLMDEQCWADDTSHFRDHIRNAMSALNWL